MSKKHYTANQLKDMAADYFASNPDAEYLVASTHDGIFYRPENAGYALSGANANGGELVKVTRQSEARVLAGNAMNMNLAHLILSRDSYHDVEAFVGAHLTRVANGEDVVSVLADIMLGKEGLIEAPQSEEEVPATSLADVVAHALHLPGYFAEPAPAVAPAPEASAPAEPAPAPKKPRAKAAPKAAAKTKASTPAS